MAFERSISRAVEELRDWVVEQKEFCRPPEYADMPAEGLDELRGPSAAYGAVVYGLVESRLNTILGAVWPEPTFTPEELGALLASRATRWGGVGANARYVAYASGMRKLGAMLDACEDQHV